MLPTYLSSSCQAVCRQEKCPDAVKLNTASGTWYITIGHAGFNSPTNNKFGYATESSARSAMIRYLRK